MGSQISDLIQSRNSASWRRNLRRSEGVPASGVGFGLNRLLRRTVCVALCCHWTTDWLSITLPIPESTRLYRIRTEETGLVFEHSWTIPVNLPWCRCTNEGLFVEEMVGVVAESCRSGAAPFSTDIPVD
jgi:hypothetical protein